MNRHFTVAVFIVYHGKVLLLRHRKLNMWLPPGGHIDPNELPDSAAVREVKEETGLDVVLIGDKGLNVDYPHQLVIPRGIQVEDIEENHQHIDLVYFATVKGNNSFVSNDESDAMGWYGLYELPEDVNDEIRMWCEKAIKYL
ncbi:NUDIX hydrolase [Alkalicella caledoniensis]|uniref:NUDIX hydrolase n=1 Tax=Alkalicella caledoniensis TaxID=2731377 RepID=A0A7G9W569_ALKCA|nr:NUDIX hydrolase [Alkalicella caledoniensis]QNO13831.1 NUDIX hydrolase [Alkalicella caledoniensis]